MQRAFANIKNGELIITEFRSGKELGRLNCEDLDKGFAGMLKEKLISNKIAVLSRSSSLDFPEEYGTTKENVENALMAMGF